jgi:hypothetical protein
MHCVGADSSLEGALVPVVPVPLFVVSLPVPEDPGR